MPEYFPLLSVLVFLPALGALVMALALDDENQDTPHGWALAIALAGLLPAAAVLARFDSSIEPRRSPLPLNTKRTDFDATAIQTQLQERYDGMANFVGSRYHLAVDGTNIWLVLLTALMAPVVVVASSAIRQRSRDYFILMLLLQSAVLGAFLSQDLLLFFMFFEFTLLPGYLLIGQWGGTDRRYAAGRFFLYTFAGSVATFAGIIWLALFYSRISGRPLTFDIQELYTLLPVAVQAASPETQRLWTDSQTVLMIVLLGAFAVKIPLFPFHSWLPASYVQSPTGVTVMLSALLSKLGIFGLLKFVIPLVPHGAVTVMPMVAGLAAVGVLYAAFVALASRDIKHLLAYSSLSHMSWMVVGAFALNVEGLGGSLIQMVNHAIATAGLFVVTGLLFDRCRSRDMDAYGGLWRTMPVMAAFFILFTLSSVGLPGLNGFVGEFLILAGMFSTTAVTDAGAVVSLPGPVLALVTGGGVVLGAWYMMGLLRAVLTGPERFPLGVPQSDLSAREIAALMPLALLVFAIGLMPSYFLKPVEKSATGLVEVMRRGGVEVQRSIPQRPTAPKAYRVEKPTARNL